MELKVQSERVLEAASKCSQAKEALKTLFPEAFTEEPIYYGSFSVTPKFSGISGRFLAITDKNMLEGYRKSHSYGSGLVVVVLCPSTNSNVNGWSYFSWQTFHAEWKTV